MFREAQGRHPRFLPPELCSTSDDGWGTILVPTHVSPGMSTSWELTGQRRSKREEEEEESSAPGMTKGIHPYFHAHSCWSLAGDMNHSIGTCRDKSQATSSGKRQQRVAPCLASPEHVLSTSP